MARAARRSPGWRAWKETACAFAALIIRPDGSETHETTREGSRADASALGADAGQELKRRAPADFFHE